MARPDDPLRRPAVPPRRDVGPARLPGLRHAARAPATPSSRSRRSCRSAAWSWSPRRRTWRSSTSARRSPCSGSSTCPSSGVVENMSYFVAPDTGRALRHLRRGRRRAGSRTSSACRCSARIPLEIDTRKGGDAGVPITVGAARLGPGARPSATLAAAVDGARRRGVRRSSSRPSADARFGGDCRLPADLSAPGPDVLPAHAAAAAHLRGALPRDDHRLPRPRPAPRGRWRSSRATRRATTAGRR